MGWNFSDCFPAQFLFHELETSKEKRFHLEKEPVFKQPSCLLWSGSDRSDGRMLTRYQAGAGSSPVQAVICNIKQIASAVVGSGEV